MVRQAATEESILLIQHVENTCKLVCMCMELHTLVLDLKCSGSKQI